MKIVIGIVLLLQFASYVLLGWVHFFGNHHPHIPVSFMLMIAVGAFQVLVFLSGAAAWYLARSNRRLLACSLALAVPGLLCLAVAAYFRLSF
jgi:hypothetical protein